MAVTVAQQGVGTFQNTANPTITFGSALTVNNVIVLGWGCFQLTDANLPTGYTAGPESQGDFESKTCWKIVDAADTSAQFTGVAGNQDSSITYMELTGTDITSPLDGSSEDETNISTTTKTIATDSGSGITPTLADGGAVALFMCANGFNFQSGSNSLDNSFTLDQDFGQVSAISIAAIGHLLYTDTNAKKCTLTTTDVGDANYGAMLLFKAAAGGGVGVPVSLLHRNQMRHALVR